MSNLFRRHFEREQARLAQGKDDIREMSAYQKILYQLRQDKITLKAIKPKDDKIVAKADMLPNYAAWVQGVLGVETPDPKDEVFSTILIWMIDTGNLDQATEMAQFAIEHSFEATDDFQRPLPEIIIEQLAEELAAGAEISQDNIVKIIEWVSDKKVDGTHELNINDVVRAKFLKAAGEWMLEHENKESALILFEAALSYNNRSGVKQLIKSLKAELANTEQ